MNNIVDFSEELEKRRLDEIRKENKKKDNLKIDNIFKLLKLVEYGVVSNIEIICDMGGKTYYVGENNDTYIRKGSLMNRINSVDSYINIFD